MKNARPYLAVLGIAMVAGALWLMVRSRHAGRAGQAAGPPVTLQFYKDARPLTPFKARTLDGKEISSEDFRGKVAIVNFWATWCPPCRAEIPDLVALQDKYRDQLIIVGISEDEGPQDGVRKYAADKKMNYPIVMTTPELERIFTGISALPTSFIIDRDGRIVQKHVGMLSAELTEQETRSLAGLPVNATVELIDRDKPVPLSSTAEVTKLPGVDLTKLTPAQRATALQRLNAEPCTCGCNLTVAKCRVDDPSCNVSLPLANTLVDEIVKGGS